MNSGRMQTCWRARYPLPSCVGGGLLMGKVTVDPAWCSVPSTLLRVTL